MSYGFVKTVNASFDEARESVIAELKKEGFGILTEIDLKEKFREKLGVEYRRYNILGACNPPFALKSLQAEENLGLLLPCNVIVYETGDGTTTVGIIRPSTAMGMVDNDALGEVAGEVEAKLNRVFDRL
ncbi:MAG: DUF302 domain-containing protein [Candidatus Latescibacteria bacterium]|nr:DUF302 domain-containing protein [Candidatus Latescibacterota bacterium]